MILLTNKGKLNLEYTKHVLSLQPKFEDSLDLAIRLFEENKMTKTVLLSPYPQQITGSYGPSSRTQGTTNKANYDYYNSPSHPHDPSSFSSVHPQNKSQQLCLKSESEPIFQSLILQSSSSVNTFCENIKLINKNENNTFKSFVFSNYLKSQFEELIKKITKEEEFLEIVSVVKLKITELMTNMTNESLINIFKTKFNYDLVYTSLVSGIDELIEIKLKEFQTLSYSYNHRSILEFEKDLKRFSDVELIIKIMTLIVPIYTEKIIDRNIKEVYNTLDQISTEGILELICNKYFDCKSNLHDIQNILNQISGQLETFSGKNSKSLNLLFELFSEIVSESEFRPEEERSSLIRNPDTKSKWCIMLKKYQRLNKINPLLFKKLLDNLIKLYKDIETKNVTVDEATSILYHEDEQRKEFTSYLSIGVEIEGLASKQKLDFILQEMTKKIYEVDEEKSIMKSFISNFIEKYCIDYKNLIETDWIMYQSSYLKSKLAFVKLPEKLIPFKEIAFDVSPILSSDIFMNYYFKAKIKASQLYPAETLANILRSSYDEMKKEINLIFTNFNEYKVERIKPILSTIYYAESELGFINKFIQVLPEHRIMFTSLHKILGKESKMEKFCECLLKQPDLFGFFEIDNQSISKSEDFIQKCIKDQNLVTCKDYLETSNQTFLNLTKDLTDNQITNFIQITESFTDSAEYREFCLKITAEELENLKESVNDFEDVLATTQDILDFQLITSFIQKVHKKDSFNSLISVYNEFLDTTDLEFCRKVEISMKKVVQLKELHLNLHLKEQAKKLQIIQIYEKSRVKLMGDSSQVEFLLEYDMIRNNTVVKTFKVNIESLSELKDRAALMENNEREKKAEMKIMAIFIELVNTLFAVIQTIQNLGSLGYPDIQIPDGFMMITSGDFSVLTEVLSYFTECFDCWEKSINSAYESFYLLTNLHGNQFWLLENYFRRLPCDQSKARTLLEFLQKEEKFEGYLFEQTWQVEARLKYLGSYLERLTDKPGRGLAEVIKKQNIQAIIIHEENVVLCLKYNNLLKGIFSIFLLAGYDFPSSKQILYCTGKTSSVEVRSFVFRCFKDSKKRLYLMVNNENLSHEIQTVFCFYFQKLLDDAVNKDFKFGLIYFDDQSAVHSFFKYHKSVRIQMVKESEERAMDDKLVRQIISVIDKNSLVITSEEVGFGKTFTANRIAKRYKRELVDYSISGEINFNLLVQDLNLLCLKRNQILLLNVGENSNKALVNELIMNLSLFRTLISDTEVFILPDTVDLFIEVSNSFENQLFKSLNYLQYLQREHIHSFNLSDFQMESDLIVETNHVCNYIQLFKQGKLDTSEINYSNPTSLKTLNHETIVDHLKFAIAKTENKVTNFILLRIFIQILSNLLKGFENSIFSIEILECLRLNFRENNLDFVSLEFGKLRSTIFLALLITTNEFTTISARNVKSEQQDARSKSQTHELDLKVKWNFSNHFLLIFTEDGGVSINYRDHIQVPKDLKRLIFTQCNYQQDGPRLSAAIKSNNYPIEDFSTLTNDEYIQKLQGLSRQQDLKNLLKNTNYAITSDNYLKMCSIFIRAQSLTPVVTMGETGIGKTSLIRFFVRDVLGEKLDIFCVHAGLTKGQIIERILLLDDEARVSSQRVWVFLDEFNTNENVGVLSEIMVSRKISSRQLHHHLIFVAACNQYRLRSSRIMLDNNVGIRKKQKNFLENCLLTHMVFPLPDRIIQYIWDFGSLSIADMKKYITNMMGMDLWYFRDLFSELIMIAHSTISESEDRSSVSLRDVTRFIRLFKWFLLSKETRRQIDSGEVVTIVRDDQGSIQRSQQLELECCVLSYCHCYYLRISSEKERQNFLSNIESRCSFLNPSTIHELLENEQMDYLNRMKLSKDIAKNKALKENVFAIIPCILERIPVFICGKPGCSKSLSISLIFSNLRGTKSEDLYFKTLPDLIQVSYQGSESCTSEGIQKIFEKAEKFLFKESINILPVIIFDEIGLAEISENSPLKVLHSLLELENNKVGFVAISNWRLDASKMNRVLYLARTDPSLEELILTGENIFESIGILHQEFPGLIRSLAQSYTELKDHLSSLESIHGEENAFSIYNKDIYGLRDFYFLLKNICHRMKNTEIMYKENIFFFVKYSIERNFGGWLNAAEFMLEKFSELYNMKDFFDLNQKIPAKDLIKQSFYDTTSRYLMIIGESEVATFLLDKQIKKEKKIHKLIVGSLLKDDMTGEDYAFRRLSRIIHDMENGSSITLCNLDRIYSSLYDLFNQNFSGNERKYCRVALGAYFNPRCYLHPDFRVVIFVDHDLEKISKLDPPFLNRFEKHYLTIDEFLEDEDQIRSAENIRDWVFSILGSEKPFPQQKIFQSSNFLHFFPCFSEQSVKLLVIHMTEKLKSSNQNLSKFDLQEKVEKKYKSKLLKTSPVDIKIISGNSNLEKSEKDFISSKWNKSHSLQFHEILSNLIKCDEIGKKIMIITYQNEPLTRIFGDDDDNKVIQSKLLSFKAEKDLDKSIFNFFESSFRVFIFNLEFILEFEHLMYLKEKIDNAQIEFKDKIKGKHFLIVVSIPRNEKLPRPVPIYFEWTQKMMDMLISKGSIEKDYLMEINENLLRKSTKELIIDAKLFNFSENIVEITENALNKLNPKIDSGEHLQYKHRIRSRIKNEKKLIDLFEKTINTYLRKLDETAFKDWKLEIFSKSVADQSKDAKNAIMKCIKNEIELVYLQIVHFLEKNQTFSSYFCDLGKTESSLLKEIWKNNFESRNIIDNQIKLQNLELSNEIENLGFSLDFPFSKFEIEIIRKIFEEVSNVDLVIQLRMFCDRFENESILKESLREFNEIPALHEVYLMDLIRLLMNSQNEKNDLDYLVFRLFSLGFKVDTVIQVKVFKILKNFKKILSLVKVYHVVLQVDDECGFKLLCVFEDFISKEEKIDEELEGFSDEDSQEERSDENYSFEDCGNDRNEFKVFLKAFGILVDQLISDFLMASSKENLNCLLAATCNVLNIVSNLSKGACIQFNQIDSLEFFQKLLEFAISADFSSDEFFLICRKVFNEGKVDYFEIKEIILSLVDRQIEEKGEKVAFLSFKLYYLMSLSIDELSTYELIIDLIDTTGIWQVSSEFFSLLLDDIKFEKITSNFYKKVLSQDTSLTPSLILEENEETSILNKVLSIKGIQTRFSILLSDVMERMLTKNTSENFSNEFTFKSLSKSWNDFLVQSSLNENGLLQLICLSITRRSLKIYLKFLEKLDEDTVYKGLFDDFLNSNETLQLFCVKYFCDALGMSYKNLNQYLNSNHLTWLNTFDQVDNLSLSVKVICEQQNEYSSIVQTIHLIQSSTNSIKNLNHYLTSFNSLLPLGSAFINEVYPQFYFGNSEIPETCSNWLKSQKTVILTTFGDEIFNFLQSLSSNFTPDSSLRLKSRSEMQETNDYESNVLQPSIGICFQFLLSLSVSRSGNSIASLFFDKESKILNELDKVFNSKFIPGAILNTQVREVKENLENFERLKNFGFLKCSENCSYVFVKDENGIVAEKIGGRVFCPVCYVEYQGEGLKDLQHEEALKMLQENLEKHYLESPKGLYLTKLKRNSNFFTFLEPVSFSLLNFSVHAMLLVLIETGAFDSLSSKASLFNFTSDFEQSEAEDILNNRLSSFLFSSCVENLARITKELKKISCKEPLKWFYFVLPSLNKPDLQSPFTTQKDRENFEKSIEKTVLPSLKDPAKVLLSYEQHFQEETKEKLVSEAIFDNSRYPFLSQFRRVPEATLDNIFSIFANHLSTEEKDSKYFLVKIFLKNQEKIKVLKNLFPIIQFSNTLTQKFNHKISRDQGKIISIQQVLESENEKKQFEEFKLAWQNIPEEFFTFQGKSTGKQVLKNDLNLASFLIDNKEERGVAGVIINLCNLHNSLLKIMLEKSGLDVELKRYPPHCLTEENIIQNFYFESSHLTSLCLNDPEYGKGSNLIFDFSSLQTNLMNDLHKKKIINIDKLNGIQYQFEIFTSFDSESNPIDCIRKKIKQVDLGQKEENELKNYLCGLEKEFKFTVNNIIKDLYSASSSVLLELKFEYFDKNENVEDFCKRLSLNGKNVHEKFMHDSIFKKSLKFIVSIHSLIETFYFKFYQEKLLRIEFQDFSQEKEIKELIDFMRKNEKTFPGNEILKNVLIRFMIRCGAGELDFNLMLANYLFRNDFWPEGRLENEKKNLKDILSFEEFYRIRGLGKSHRFPLRISSAFEFYRQLSGDFMDDKKIEVMEKHTIASIKPKPIPRAANTLRTSTMTRLNK